VRHWTIWIFAAALVGAAVIRVPRLDRPLDGSEVDYVLAARRGFLTNYFDLGTRPVWAYVEAGLAAAGLAGDGPGQDLDLWRRDSEANDIAAYRHYHPPLFIYSLHAIERLAGYSDATVRLVPLAFSLATIATLYLGCLLLIPVRGAQVGLVAAAILSMLSLHVATAADIGWHVAYTCLASVALFAMAYLVTRPSLHALVAAVVTTTLAFMTLEHAVFLYVTLAIVLLVTDNPWLRVSRSGVSAHRHLLLAAGAGLVTMLVVWPASLVKLSMVKNLGVHAYYARTLDLSPRFYDVYLVLLDRDPVLIGLAAVTTILTVMRRSRLPRALLPFALYPLVMCLIQIGNQNLKPLYFVSLLPSLALLSAVWLVDTASDARPRVRWAGRVGAAAVAVALMFDVQQALRTPRRSNANRELMNRLARVEDMAGANVLTWPAGSHTAQMLHFYLPDTRFVRVIDEPQSVRAAAAAVRRGTFRFVVVDVAADDRAPAVLPALWTNYRPLFDVRADAETDGFEVWQRRE
jgi:4-amino-4-deoxy-L-arabinose transferase-like glycosyltransferase